MQNSARFAGIRFQPELFGSGNDATRQDTYEVTVTVFRPGTKTPIIKGVWDKMSGGQVDSEETKYYPGGMVDPISIGGRRTAENVTVSRLYRIGRDHKDLQALINVVGRAPMTVSRQPLNTSGSKSDGADPIVWTGTLKRVTPPDVDSEGNAAGMIELEMTVDGFPTA
jgi:hypothetical protein